ncbi:MAG: asparagine synthase (glutamine-hydrolyzing), partial [Acidobacteria bacterium]|nr:asparagine synthase (glutamine-hydrolyzing) [Acidobacteriota bacterium]
MCGISGLFALDGPIDPSISAAIRPMNDAIRHRGPDGDGFFTDQRAALGHRRLAIIDVSGGAQPISNEDGTVWIVFNGEVYNHLPLRAELIARGHQFKTRSDTETILHAYEEFGTDTPARLEGMFAFAIYDQRRQRLFAARDRLGKKPFFFAVLDRTLHFASEIRSLFASPAWKGDLDLSSFGAYLSLGYVPAPRSVFRDVRKLMPGHWLLAADGRIEEREYWDVTEFDTDRRPAPVVLEELDALLRQAVADRLESEVPLGAFLSGGIDSGLIVSYMADSMGRPPVTTSVGFGGSEHNELAAAAITAKSTGSTHFAHTLTPKLDDVFDTIVRAFSEPFADSSAVPTYYVSQAARQHVTVALSGDGGDESFSGYDFRYVPHAYEQRARRFVPGAPGRALAGAAARVWPRSQALPRPLRLGTILDNLSHDSADAYFLDLCFLKPRDAHALMGLPGDIDFRTLDFYDTVTGPYRRCPSSSDVQRAQYADLKVYMPNDPLVKVDRMSMVHSLEVRCPLLDRRVVEFAFRLPTETKMAGLQGKRLLRDLASRRLPAELSRMPKLGFTAPVRDWLRGPVRGAFADEVLAPGSATSTVVDAGRLRGAFDQHVRGERDHS